MPPQTQSWTQKHGSFALALVMAVCTGAFWLFDSDRNGKEAKKTAEAAQQLAQRIDREGSAFARETRQMVLTQGEKIAKVETNQDKAMDVLMNIRESQAELRQQVAYLVQLAAQNKHARNESTPSSRSAVASSR